MSPLTINTALTLSKALHEELGPALKGDLIFHDDPSFLEYSTVFNGNVVTRAKAVTCPLDAEDVSTILRFCTKYSLSPSIKAGGYGTAGWAIGGDIIVDLNRLRDLDIEAPLPGGSYTSLKDTPTAGSKGKGKAGEPTVDDSLVSTGKRRRDDDAKLRVYDSASRAMATFLKGPTLPSFTVGDYPSPSIRRRMETELELYNPYRQDTPASDESVRDSSSPEAGSQTQSSDSTTATSPSPPYTGANKQSPAPSGGDPFGYLASDRITHTPTLFRPVPSQSNFSLQPTYGASWSTGPNALMANPSLQPNNLFSQAVPVHAHAYVTFGAGMKQKEIDTFTARNPLEATSPNGVAGFIPYHVPFAAHPVGSSIMLLGGFGFLSRLHGLSVDNLVEVEMVLYDGQTIVVNKDEHPDLWWAVRGAGPAFGVATRYKARAFPVPVVFAGNLIYRFHPATAPSLIRHFRDCVKGAPRELYANVLLTAGPKGKESLVVIQMCYVGPREKGQEYLAAISSWDGERCLLNEVDEKSFLHQQDSVAQVLRGKRGNQWFIRSALITSLPDETINETVMQFSDTPVGCTWLFELAGGAVIDFEDTCLPKVQREAAFTVAALHQWDMGNDDARCIESAEEWIADTLTPVTTGGPFPSFLGRHEPVSRTMACFGDNWSRLAEIKKKYDPNGLFRNTFWPLGADGQPVEPRDREPPTPTLNVEFFAPQSS